MASAFGYAAITESGMLIVFGMSVRCCLVLNGGFAWYAACMGLRSSARKGFPFALPAGAYAQT